MLFCRFYRVRPFDLPKVLAMPWVTFAAFAERMPACKAAETMRMFLTIHFPYLGETDQRQFMAGIQSDLRGGAPSEASGWDSEGLGALAEHLATLNRLRERTETDGV